MITKRNIVLKSFQDCMQECLYNGYHYFSRFGSKEILVVTSIGALYSVTGKDSISRVKEEEVYTPYYYSRIEVSEAVDNALHKAGIL